MSIDSFGLFSVRGCEFVTWCEWVSVCVGHSRSSNTMFMCAGEQLFIVHLPTPTRPTTSLQFYVQPLLLQYDNSGKKLLNMYLAVLLY